MNEQSLALRAPPAPSAEELQTFITVADKMVKERMVPVAVKTGGQALCLIMTGQELGIGPMRSVQDLYFVKGNIGITTKLMVALFRRAGHYHEIIVKTPQHCKVVLHLKQGRAVTVEFTRAEVDKLGYPYYWKQPQEGGPKVKTQKPQWITDPALLLYNRTMTKGIRTHAPETLYGMPTKDELQDEQYGFVSREHEVSLEAFLQEYYPDVLEDYLRGDKAPAAGADAEGQVVNGESRELPPSGDNGQEGPGETEPEPAKHWIDCVDTTGESLRTRFWTWALQEKELSSAEVYAALGTTTEQQFPPMKETKARVQAYIDKHGQLPVGAATQGVLLEEDIPF